MSGWEVVVLGIAQDGGVPHVGCRCTRCGPAFDGLRRRERVACLGLTNGERAYLFDATPDLPDQLHALGARRPDAVFLTHAHMGHINGLPYLGREALATATMPLHATPAMHAFLSSNAPYSDLYEQSRVTAAPNDDVDLGGVRVRSMQVPHRNEHGDTVAYVIESETKSVLFLPDIDRWDTWDRDVREEVAAVDVAYIDGSFLSRDELPRMAGEVPHPPVTETMDLLDGLGDRVRFIHLNHTNPLLDDPAPVRAREFDVAVQGERIALG